jgi:hypothetical protein
MSEGGREEKDQNITGGKKKKREKKCQIRVKNIQSEGNE